MKPARSSRELMATCQEASKAVLEGIRTRTARGRMRDWLIANVYTSGEFAEIVDELRTWPPRERRKWSRQVHALLCVESEGGMFHERMPDGFDPRDLEDYLEWEEAGKP